MREFHLSIFLLFVLPFASFSKKAYYLEEGPEHTYATNIEQTPELNNQVLELLDLKAPTVAPVREKRHDRVSTYMEKLYKQLELEDKILNEEAESKDSSSIWSTADKIMTLTAEEVTSYGENMYKLKYVADNFLSDNKKPTLSKAELHLFLRDTEDVVNVKLYSEKNGKLNLILSKSESSANGEFILNVTDLVQKWLKDSMQSTIYVQLSQGESIIDSFIVAAFTEVSESKSTKNRSRRSVDSPIPTKRSENENVKEDVREENENDGGCKRHGLYVNFENLGWKSWVIAPEGYSAFYCDGGCSYPLHNKMNASNHAIVQYLAHSINPSRAEDTKCAPTVLTPLKILFIDNHKNVVMKKYRDMVVQECGCH
ncbi:unnamed protein product [Auanema sp. JU1783]|nr:unnamed protein product [Auanema sp. JU1783]